MPACPWWSIYAGDWPDRSATYRKSTDRVAVTAAVRPLPSGEVMGVAQAPPTRRGRPGRSGLIHGAVGPMSSRTTSRQPVVTIEVAVTWSRLGQLECRCLPIHGLGCDLGVRGPFCAPA